MIWLQGDKVESRCPICYGYKTNSTTTFSVDLGFGVVVVRHVPAVVCEQCGIEWINDDNAEKLEEIVSLAKEKQTMIEVSEFSVLDKLAS